MQVDGRRHDGQGGSQRSGCCRPSGKSNALRFTGGCASEPPAAHSATGAAIRRQPVLGTALGCSAPCNRRSSDRKLQLAPAKRRCATPHQSSSYCSHQGTSWRTGSVLCPTGDGISHRLISRRTRRTKSSGPSMSKDHVSLNTVSSWSPIFA